MATVKINGTLNGKEYYEFKGSVTEAIKFMHKRQDIIEKKLDKLHEKIENNFMTAQKRITNIQTKTAALGGTIAVIVTLVLKFLLK